MRKLSSLIAFILFLGYGYAQELPEIVPSSPEAAALGKYGDIPISAYTGVPSVSIPLTTLQGSSLSIPISLNYHASGVRVNEIASRVGLGWSMSSLGSITRSYRGLPDDWGDGFINTNYSVGDFLTGTLQEIVNNIENVQGNYDFESDIYNYNILGEHGKFFFTSQGDVVTFPKSDIDISPVMNASRKIIGWEVITTSGTTFYLGTSKDGNRSANDTSTVYSTNGSTIPMATTPLTNYTTTWHLMDIETYDGNLTTFEYDRTGISFWNVTSQSRRIAGFNGVPAGDNTSYANNEDRVHRVTSITNDNGSLLFHYELLREDLKGDSALTELELVDTFNNIIETYQMEYDYFVSTQLHNNNLGDLDQRRKRLYLKNVKQVFNDQSIKNHTFTYNTQHILPDRFSFAQDFWGYYNGRHNNTRLYPEIQWSLGGTFATIPGGDRKVYEPYAKACVLTKIEYPTGGSTEFDFESNRISNQPFFGLTNMVSTTIGGASSINSNANEFVEDIIINDPSPYLGGINWNVRMDTCANPNSLGCPYAELYIIKNNQEQLLARSNGQNMDRGIEYDSRTPLRLRIKLYNDSGGIFGDRKDIRALITGFQLEANAQNAITAGGLRVKQITNYDTNGEKILQKNYEYTFFDDPTTSSGGSLNPPTFIQKNVPFCSNESPIALISDVLKSNSIFPLTNGSGYVAGYTQVTELLDNGNQGKNEFTHSFTYDGDGYQSNVYERGGPTNAVLITPLQDFSHRRGLLLNKKTYAKNKNDGFDLLEQTKNDYTELGQLLSDDNIVMDHGKRQGPGSGSCHAGYTTYQNLSERYLMTQTQKTNYHENGNVVSTTQYTHDVGYHGRTFPKTTTTINSNNQTIEVTNFFADDVSSVSSLEGGNLSSNAFDAISDMKKNGIKKRIGQPIQTETIRDGAKTTQRTNFKIWDNQIIAPEFVQTAKGSDNLENRIQYYSYDDYGNPLEISKADNTHIIYIWGYNNEYPIAKIENASYTNMLTATRTLINQIKAASDNENTDTEEDALRAMFDTLRQDGYFVQTPMITSYTYDPLIGITSITDPRGYTMTYHYDAFNRLEYVKDAAGNLISENQYNYKN
ncbi:RHS repeat domain-containing protein [uncultured Aquimarina sp.]|uniref:RHS repeat protein n=1 Tax=uncultured Aquimarina sp. TaxID=575652 RepID=UPI002627E9FC|nr:RHS repeat domain-containing protein [uncultured Aquimarina sp.]